MQALWILVYEKTKRMRVSLSRHRGDRIAQSFHDARHRRITNLVGRIECRVVILIAIERGVRHHHRWISLTPEREVIAPSETGDRLESGKRFDRKIGMVAKRVDQLAQRLPRAQVRNDRHEIRPIRIEKAKERWIALAAWPIGVEAEHLERYHETNVVASVARRLRIHHAAHLLRCEEWRLFVDEGHETHGALGREPREIAVDLE